MHVFPACAGIVRKNRGLKEFHSWSSPRARGSFSQLNAKIRLKTVLLALAGIFLYTAIGQRQDQGLPRACGDRSQRIQVIFSAKKSSSRVRGSFFPFRSGTTRRFVFPAHAGIFPYGSAIRSDTDWSSPHAWGSVLQKDTFDAICADFPAPAGIVLIPAALVAVLSGLPCVRRDISFGDLMTENISSLPRACGDLSGPWRMHSVYQRLPRKRGDLSDFVERRKA